MTIQEEVSIKFPRVQNQFNLMDNTFVINYIKSRTPSVVYFKLHCYNLQGQEILTNNDAYYIGERWIIDNSWRSYHSSFDFTEEILNNLKEVQIELRLIGVDDDNPLYFTECMLLNKEFDGDYHETDEKDTEAEIGFVNNRYANLYTTNEDDYLQVIRPTSTAFTTNKLSKSECTVLAPHIVGETEWDKPVNLYMEYINQTEQTTNIKPI